MNLAAAIAQRNAAELPGKRDEDWRWTDLRGLVREVPPPSAAFKGELPAGPFDAQAAGAHVLANGGRTVIEVPAGAEAVEVLRFVSRGAGSHSATAAIRVGEGGRLTLLESYESDGGALSDAMLTIELASGAAVERIVLAEDHEDAVSVSQAEVSLGPAARFAQTVIAGGARRQRLESHVRHPGGGADLRLDGIYLLAGKRHSDQTSVVTHAGVDGVTEEL
ncbi:MAG: SufD family Fe-S cluster assembly protein, partial [Proteobacteria bacterium]|nr:SufD family Fe-S cluster assembly protein [Pseudomonadota bacterium]